MLWLKLRSDYKSEILSLRECQMRSKLKVLHFTVFKIKKVWNCVKCGFSFNHKVRVKYILHVIIRHCSQTVKLACFRPINIQNRTFTAIWLVCTEYSVVVATQVCHLFAHACLRFDLHIFIDISVRKAWNNFYNILSTIACNITSIFCFVWIFFFVGDNKRF